MKYIQKIKTYKEIKNIINTGEKTVLKTVVVYKILQNEPSKKLEIGILSSKKFGNAVKRNKARRLIIAILTQIFQSLSKNYKYVFIPRSLILQNEFAKMKEEFEKKL